MTSAVVTVIVPAFNAQRHVEGTLRSVLAQRGIDLVVHVIDDRSTDSTATLVQAIAAHDDRVQYSCTARNFGGPAEPRNLGVEQATTPWIAFCDADDLWHPDKLRLQLQVARHTGADLVCTGIEPFPDGTEPRTLDEAAPQEARFERIGVWQMLLKNRIATSSVLCRRQVLADTGRFDPAPDMRAVEDYDLWLRMMTGRNAQVVRLRHRLVAYRHMPGQLSASKWRQAIKIMRVHRSIFAIKGWTAWFPLAAPILMFCYVTSWLYLRSLVRRPT